MVRIVDQSHQGCVAFDRMHGPRRSSNTIDRSATCFVVESACFLHEQRAIQAGTLFAWRVGGMSWFRVSGGRLEYRGRITRESFRRWASSKEGADAVARVAAGLRFSLFGRARAARRRMWRALHQASCTRAVTTAIANEAPRYMQAAAHVAYADGLPRANVALHRLVLVPRAMIAGHARVGLFKRLNEVPELAALDDAVRIFFFDQIVLEMDAALQKATPSPRDPVQAHDEWACVGVRQDVVWVDPVFSGPDGVGHVFLYEFPRTGITRKDRKALEGAIHELSAGVTSLSKLQRHSLVRMASAR
jgi:hypothetical protein